MGRPAMTGGTAGGDQPVPQASVLVMSSLSVWRTAAVRRLAVTGRTVGVYGFYFTAVTGDTGARHRLA